MLNVCNWSDYVAEDTIANFEKATGIKVNYDVYSENETLETKLTAGSSGYDVVFPSARPFAQRQVKGGLYLALDKARLPNLSHLDPAIMQGLQDVDPANAHVVPHMWGTTGLGINVDKVKAALGDGAPIDSWNRCSTRPTRPGWRSAGSACWTTTRRRSAPP
ncbi:MAG: extracellular solute-binding protein [Thermomonas sp.]|nr:extracellular solute-binding protein [Thermomonas sp.]